MTKRPRKSTARPASASKTRKRSSPVRTVAAVRGRCILRLPGVMAKTGLTRTEVYRKLGHLRIRLGPNTAGWVEAEIEKWIGERIAESRAGVAAE